jgi:uncharacterized protein
VTVIAVAAVSARMLTEAAASDGFDVIALDLFGDADTRLAAQEWLPLGEAGSLHIDGSRTLAALRALTRRGGVSGWVAGSGFEGQPELLDKAASLLPLLGTSPEAVARVRDPAAFFGFLASQEIAHPPVLLGQGDQLPLDDGSPWLMKDARGCGGWHVRPASPQEAASLPEHHYLQQRVPGVPMSATFIGNGHEAVVLGFNELTVRAFGSRPFVFCGAVGPVGLPPQAASRVRTAVRALTDEFALRGLCSLDFMLDGDEVAVLEINPRPPASMGLYGARRFGPEGGGLLSAHVRACQYGELPSLVAPAHPGRVEGFEIVFAPHGVQVDDAVASRLVSWPGCHDLPCSGTRIAAGDPLCSLSAEGETVQEVRAALQSAREALLTTLEPAS